MWCGIQFSTGHKCGVKAHLYQLFLEENIELSSDQDEFTESVDLIDDTNSPTQDADSYPIITLHALLGADGPQTMQVVGKIKNQLVTILIDTASTHNFINTSIAKRLGCHTVSITTVPVTIADGNDLSCREMCKQLRWEVQGLIQYTDMVLI
ncbi:hypothetical protein COLO4_16541 [Corchorus olitorius]|uniref:Aspartic peptidase n=1 Tax=Corchorus olitorius TaxID=93759 RepID=A0A1R3JGT6_9ROSI|nr:hypothetical protein COLO4_16541 [Corchorus olitorius]